VFSEFKYDVIIDDGPHSLHTQQFTVANYFNLLKPGGVLIIEDIQNVHHLTLLTETTSALFSWDTTTVTDGSTYLVRVNASCSEGVWKMDISDTLFTVDNIKDNSPNFQIHWPFLFSVSSLPVIIISKKIAKRHKYSKL
jgi:hypothetical protein